jgi:hypothetical protein
MRWDEAGTPIYQIMEEDQEVVASQEIDFCTLGMFIIGKTFSCVLLVAFLVYFPCLFQALYDQGRSSN